MQITTDIFKKNKKNMFDLKRFRKEQKISQTELARLLGVGQSFISQVESGKDPIPESLILKLKEIFNVENISDYYIKGNESEDNIPIVEEEILTEEKINYKDKYYGLLEKYAELSGRYAELSGKYAELIESRNKPVEKGADYQTATA